MVSKLNDHVYAEPDPRFSLCQGDILADVPWGLIQAPLSICRPSDAKQAAGKATFGPLQGFNNPPPFRSGRPETIHARGHLGEALVIWHSCEIDKFAEKGKPTEEWFAGIVPVVRIQTEAEREAIFAMRKTAFFPLPKAQAFGLDSDRCADLRYIVPVKQALLGKRIATLTPAATEALFERVFFFFTRREPLATSVCKSCGAEINLEDFPPAPPAAADADGTKTG